MHPTQRQLRDDLAAYEIADKRVKDLDRRRDELTEQREAKRVEIEATRAELRVRAADGADPAAVARQLRGMADELDAFDEAIAGIDAQIEAAETERDKADRRGAQSAALVAQVLCARLEHQAVRELRTFARTIARRHAFAWLAARLLTQAYGEARDPFGVSNESAGYLRNRAGLDEHGLIGILQRAGLGPNFRPLSDGGATIADLLDVVIPGDGMSMPQPPEAA